MKDEQISFFADESSLVESYLVHQFSAGGFAEESERQRLENKYSRLLEVTDRFNRQSVSYQLNKNDTLHSWLKFKEGFSASLVSDLLEDMQACRGDLIMDPFMGSGTTALMCQMKGIDSIGYDILPISAVSIKAKALVLHYDLGELARLLCDVKNLTVPREYQRKTPYITITESAYPEETERFLQYIKEWHEEAEYSDEAKNLLTLCIINSLERISYTSKDGQYLGWDSRSPKVINGNRKREAKGKKPYPDKQVRAIIQPAKETIVSELERVISDIEQIQQISRYESPTDIRYIENSALFELPKLKDGILSGVITSPPYCNRYDYTRTYALELVYLGVGEKELKKMRQNLLSCTVENKSKKKVLAQYYYSLGQGDRFEYILQKAGENRAFAEIMQALKQRKENGDLNNNGIIRMVEGYFTELAFIYAELYRLCKKGGKVAFVNDNVRYGGEVIPVDFLSCSFAEQFGFKIKTIYTLKQQKGNSSQQMAKYGRVALRKSITVWEK